MNEKGVQGFRIDGKNDGSQIRYSPVTTSSRGRLGDEGLHGWSGDAERQT